MFFYFEAFPENILVANEDERSNEINMIYLVVKKARCTTSKIKLI